MKILEKISVRRRLMYVLSICVTAFVFLGVLAINEMSTLGSMTRDLYYHSLPVSNAAREIRVNIIKAQRDLRELILARDYKELEDLNNKIREADKTILDNFSIIKTQTQVENTKDLELEARKVFLQWQGYRNDVITYVKAGDINKASDLLKSVNNNFIGTLEELLTTIDTNSNLNAEKLTIESKEIESRESIILFSAICVLALIFFISFMLVTKSIVVPIDKLQRVMDKSITTGELTTVELQGNNEIFQMAQYYNELIKKLRHNFFIKDNQNKLSEKLSACETLEELAETVITDVARATSSGKGLFYVYDKRKQSLNLKGTFAFTKEDKVTLELNKGEGIVGQVALDRRPILLKNPKNRKDTISSGIIEEVPSSIYAFPLVHNEELYGVIELSALECFNEDVLEFLDSIGNIISVNLYSSIQRERIKELLKISEEARKEAHQKSEELEEANKELQRHQEYLQQQSAELQQSNAELEEQQQLLQQQSEELQQTNAELEEQHQLLQQQSEEMQQTNTILEEQQEQLNEQKGLLEEQNRRLEEYTEELSRKTQQLELTNKYKTEFLSNMSHELRTPLNSIILLSKLLLDKGKERLTEQDGEKISVINRAGQELLRLINDVLDLSKVEAGLMSLDEYKFHSNNISKELKDMFYNVALEKGLNFEVIDSVDKDLYGDEHKIAQILRNLISNAIKFTEQGEVKVEIQEDMKSEGGVIFRVKDTGIGISEEKKNIIFEEFQQGDGSVSRKYGGTGLGLSISKKLAELMEARIQVTSIAGQGSEFILTVPNLLSTFKMHFNNKHKGLDKGDSNNSKNIIKQEIYLEATGAGQYIKAYEVAYDSNVENQDDVPQDLSDSMKKNNLSLKGKTILIVDDDPRNIFTLASTLEEYDSDVIEASNGKVAIEKLHKTKVDLILMDIMMPEMDGYEAMQKIRKNSKYRNLPIIAVTAKSLKEEREKCIAMGASDYISKPVDYNNLIRIIKAWINKEQ